MTKNKEVSCQYVELGPISSESALIGPSDRTRQKHGWSGRDGLRGQVQPDNPGAILKDGGFYEVI